VESSVKPRRKTLRGFLTTKRRRAKAHAVFFSISCYSKPRKMNLSPAQSFACSAYFR
jgi:hypothetical protein